MKGRIALFYPYPWLGGLHSLVAAIHIIAEAGFEVDVFAPHPGPFPTPSFRDNRIQVHFDRGHIFASAVPVPKHVRGSQPGDMRWLTHDFLWLYNRLRPLWYQHVFLPGQRRQYQSAPYSCILGFDPEGLVVAGPLAQTLGVPLVYWSLELLFRDEITESAQLRLKEQETKFSKHADLIVIQDAWRGAALRQENSLTDKVMHYIPNGRPGKARRRASQRLRDKYNLSADRKIVLCSGGLSWWNMSYELVEAAQGWPDQYVLIMQSSSALPSAPYLQRLKQSADSKHVILEINPVPDADYQDLVDSADIGVALYQASRPGSNGRLLKNLHWIGYSSGKLSDYLYGCLPVIVNDTCGPRDLVSEYQCGIAVKHAADIGKRLSELTANLPTYSARAGTCYDEKLDLSSAVSALISWLRTA